MSPILQAGLLRPIAIPSPQQRAHRELVRQRERLVRARRSSMAQIKAFLLTYGIEASTPSGTAWSKKYIEWLTNLRFEDPVQQSCLDSLRRRFIEIDRHVKNHTVTLKCLADSPAHAAMVELLSSVPGFGWLRALTFSVEVFDWCRFPNGEAFSSILGLVPSEYSSGQRIRHGGISHSGNSRLRSVLIESCWTTIRRDAGLRTHYEALKKRRGGKRAIVAIARRMCHRLLAIACTGELHRLEVAA